MRHSAGIFDRHLLLFKLLEIGLRVAIVYDEIPDDVTNGDEHDLRFRDPCGKVGLKAKGKAKHDDSGFVVKTKVAV